jgi:hypothetical protein
MRHDIETYELIETYLRGELSDSELNSFRQRLEKDAGFKSEVLRQEKLFHLVISRSVLEIKEELQEIHIANTTKNPNGFQQVRLYSIIVSVIIAAAAVFLWLNRTADKPVAKTVIVDTISYKKVHSIPVALEDEIATDSMAIQPAKDKQPKTTLETLEQEVKNSQEVSRKLPALPDEPEAAEEVIENEILTSPDKEADLKPEPIKTEILPEEKQEIPVKQSEPASPPLFDCSQVKIIAEVRTEASCNEKPNGKIIINPESIEGGTAPYEVSIDFKENYTQSLSLDQLFAKMYTLFIKDANNCISELGRYIVESKDCSYEYAFAPDKGEQWEIPNQESTGSIKIYNKQGNLVYQELFDFLGTYYWPGESGNGNYLPMGAYMFILELDNGESIYGNVTIIR